MKHLAIILAVVLLLPVQTLGGETVSRIAAVVNDEIITTYELDREIAEQSGSETDSLSPDKKKDLRSQVLSRMIDDELIRQRSEKLQITVSDADLEAAIEDIQRQNDLSRQQLIDALRLQGVSFEEYRQSMHNQILRMKVVGREVQAQISVTDGEVRDYFREHIDEYRKEPSMRLSRLSFPVSAKAGREQREDRRRKAEEALARLRQGEEFGPVLQSYTDDRSAEGGDMGEFNEGELRPAFDRAVKNLEEGDVSDLVETDDGFHILRLVELSTGKVRQFYSVEEEIREILRERKTEERLEEWSAELKEEAHIDRRI